MANVKAFSPAVYRQGVIVDEIRLELKKGVELI